MSSTHTEKRSVRTIFGPVTFTLVHIFPIGQTSSIMAVTERIYNNINNRVYWRYTTCHHGCFDRLDLPSDVWTWRNHWTCQWYHPLWINFSSHFSVAPLWVTRLAPFPTLLRDAKYATVMYYDLSEKTSVGRPHVYHILFMRKHVLAD